MDEMGVGDRTARARKLARLTQVQLAHKANVSLSLLRKVEQGTRPASPAFIAATARVLGVGIGELTGQPYTPGRQDAAAHALIPELRRAIVAFADETPSVPMTFEELTASLDHVREGMRRARYSDMVGELPDILLGLHHLADIENPGHRLERVYSTTAYAYSKAMLFAYQYGYLDLAGLAAERCAWAADRSGDPIWPLAAEYNKALIMLYSGAYVGGLRTIDRAYTASESIAPTPDLLAVRGALHLRGSILAARAADHDTAESHLNGARELPTRSERHGSTTTGPGSEHRMSTSTQWPFRWSCPTALQPCPEPSRYGYPARWHRHGPVTTTLICRERGCCMATSSGHWRRSRTHGGPRRS